MPTAAKSPRPKKPQNPKKPAPSTLGVWFDNVPAEPVEVATPADPDVATPERHEGRHREVNEYVGRYIEDRQSRYDELVCGMLSSDSIAFDHFLDEFGATTMAKRMAGEQDRADDKAEVNRIRTAIQASKSYKRRIRPALKGKTPQDWDFGAPVPDDPTGSIPPCEGCAKLADTRNGSCCVDCATAAGDTRFVDHVASRYNLDDAREMIALWWNWPAPTAFTEEVYERRRAIRDTEQEPATDEPLPPFGVPDEVPRRSAAIERAQALVDLGARLGWKGAGFRLFDPISYFDLAAVRRDLALRIHEQVVVFAYVSVRSIGIATKAIQSQVAATPEFQVKRPRGRIKLAAKARHWTLLKVDGDYGEMESPHRGGRAYGCLGLVLPEDEKSLRREIGYCKRKGRLRPSVERFTRLQPMVRTREDSLTVAERFIGRRESRRRRKPRGITPLGPQSFFTFLRFSSVGDLS